MLQLEILGDKYNLKVIDGECDWEKIDFDKVNNVDIMNLGVFDIKDIDMVVEIDNKFLRKELEDMKKAEQDLEDMKKAERKKSELDKLKDNASVTYSLSKEELRQKRLLYFQKKNTKKDNPISKKDNPISKKKSIDI